MTNADKFFKMLSFQYKPLEKRMLANCARVGNTNGAKLAKIYRTAPSIKKIVILDRYAAFIGL